ncbi:hypothetical protein BX616_009563 [Lobosporangium transversale]|nr:hypothetical protein BX616_009563 [Lobosporangium transversale]
MNQRSHTFNIKGNADVTLKVPDISFLGGPNSAASPFAPSLPTLVSHPLPLWERMGGGGQVLESKKSRQGRKVGNSEIGDTKYNVLNAKGGLVGAATVPNHILARDDKTVTFTITFIDRGAYDALIT